MQDFRNLKVWTRAHAVTLAVYRATETFPLEERYGLSRQLRRSALSEASNIAEGCGRDSQRDFKRFLNMALGSACELEYQLLLAYDLAMLGRAEYEQISQDLATCKRMLMALGAKIAMDARGAM
jgi:four helix bundle protein